MYKINKAFTLVEVLITLAIIGVVSVLALYILNTQIFNNDRAGRVKKSYTTLTNAYKFVVISKGNVIDWSDITSETVGGNFAKTMYKAYDCGVEVLEKNNKCVPDCPDIYKVDGSTLNTCSSNKVSKLRAADGFSYAFQIEDPSCRTSALAEDEQNQDSALKYICGTAMVDIYSGSKGSNHYGADLYLYYITRNGIFPVGLSVDKKFPLDEEKCIKRASEDVIGCTAKILFDDVTIVDGKYVSN